MNYRSTEKILNSTRWVTAEGEVLLPDFMDEDHIRACLTLLYRKREYFWLNCENFKYINMFDDADQFFKSVIKQSVIWNELVSALVVDKEDFNFDIKL